MKNILILESSKTYSSTLSILLEEHKYKTFHAYTIQDAKDIIDKDKSITYFILNESFIDKKNDNLITYITQHQKLDPKIIVLSNTSNNSKKSFFFDQGIISYLSTKTSIEYLVKDIAKQYDCLYQNKYKNILIIDDLSHKKNPLQNILERKNFNVYCAQNTNKVLDILDNNTINLIFIDLETHSMDEIEFLDNIRNQKQFMNIPVLLISNDKSKEHYLEVLKHGAIDLVEQPYLIEEIYLKADLNITHSSYIKDITEQAQELNEYKRILNESDIVSKADSKGIITYVNDKFCEISGYTKEYLVGKPHNVIRHPDMPKLIFKNMWTKINDHQTFKGILKNKKIDDSEYYVDATISPIVDIHGDIKEIIAIRHDITDVMNPKKQMAADLSYIENPLLIFLKIANYDLFKEFYSESIMLTFELEFQKFVLDYFPANTSLGKVYNLGNGLFGFLKNELLNEMNLFSCLDEAVEKFKEIGISFKDTRYEVDVYFSFANESTHILDDVTIGIQHALKHKIPIVNAKNFHRDAKIRAKDKLKNIDMIKKAINQDDKFVSLFQPIINNNTGEIEKYESLIRLVDKDGNFVSPDQFLGLAKKTGYYSNITRHVINNSFEALKHTNKGITINLSLSDIENRKLRDYLLTLLTKKENIGRITIELLEDEEVKDFKTIKDFILRSKIEGNVKIAIDDFGSGYSNYERLLDFHPDILKIDGSVIKNIIKDDYSKHVVESIVLFAKKQNIKTVAEFVADESIYKLTKELGVDYSQGYYLGEPKKLK